MLAAYIFSVLSLQIFSDLWKNILSKLKLTELACSFRFCFRVFFATDLCSELQQRDEFGSQLTHTFRLNKYKPLVSTMFREFRHVDNHI